MNKLFNIIYSFIHLSNNIKVCCLIFNEFKVGDDEELILIGNFLYTMFALLYKKRMYSSQF